MDPVLIPALVALLGGSAIGSVTSYLLARKRLPIDRESAQAAAAREVATVTTALLEPMREQIAWLGEKAETAERKADDAARKSDKLGRLVVEAGDYIDDLHRRWPTHRTQPKPPPWRWLDPEDLRG